MTAIADTVLRGAIEKAVGHPAPFSGDELAAITELRVQHARDLSGLQHCTGLRGLELTACDVGTLRDVAGCRRLAWLHVLGCPIEDATPLAGHASLEEIRISFCFLRDLTPLTEIAQLRRGQFIGNPLTSSSWHDLRPRWRRTRTAHTRRVRLLEFGPEDAWEATRRMWERQVKLSFGLLDGWRPALIRPGIPRGRDVVIDACHAAPAGLIIAAEGGDDADAIFQQNCDYADSRGLPRPADFTAHRVLGDADDASDWAGSASADDTALLNRFIENFAGHAFFREDEAVAEAISARAGVALPAPLARSRAVLAGAFPDEGARFRLARYRGFSPRADALPDIWYRPIPGLYSTEERKQLFLHEAGLFPIAEWLETGHSTLAVRMNEGDRAIYEFAEQDLYNAQSEGRPITGSVYRVFSSYAELLASIGAYRLPEGDLITTTDDSGEE